MKPLLGPAELEVIVGDAEKVVPMLKADVACIDIYPDYGGNEFAPKCPDIGRVWVWGSQFTQKLALGINMPDIGDVATKAVRLAAEAYAVLTQEQLVDIAQSMDLPFTEVVDLFEAKREAVQKW